VNGALPGSGRGQPAGVTSAILGHVTVVFTTNMYAEVTEEVKYTQAAAIAAYIPRTAHSHKPDGCFDPNQDRLS
jgi:hypothetical protein